MYILGAQDWQELSRAASQEKDPKKLMELIEKLNDALEELERHEQSYRMQNSDC